MQATHFLQRLARIRFQRARRILMEPTIHTTITTTQRTSECLGERPYRTAKQVMQAMPIPLLQHPDCRKLIRTMISTTTLKINLQLTRLKHLLYGAPRRRGHASRTWVCTYSFASHATLKYSSRRLCRSRGADGANAGIEGETPGKVLRL